MVNGACSPTSRPPDVVGAVDDCCWEIAPDDAASGEVVNDASEIPRIDRLRDLERKCFTNHDEREFWRCMTCWAAVDLGCSLDAVSCEIEGWRNALRFLEYRRYEFRRGMEYDGCDLMLLHEGAEIVITDEINLFFQRILGDDDMPLASK